MRVYMNKKYCIHVFTVCDLFTSILRVHNLCHVNMKHVFSIIKCIRELSIDFY